MYLHEYQSKQYFARFGIPTPPGRTATTQQAAREAAEQFAVPVVVNAQALDGERVLRLAATPTEAEHVARDILAMTISGVRVRTLLIEPAQDVEAEMSLRIDIGYGGSLIMQAAGPGQRPVQELINPFVGLHDFQARNLANSLNLPRESWGTFIQMAQGLYRCFMACDAIRAEINPLGLLRSGDLMALAGKLIVDDNALYRQAEIAGIRDTKAEHDSVVQARAAGLSYVRLNGTVGCIVNGAGLGLATMDMLAEYGKRAASFFDLASEVTSARISAALRIILPEAQAVLINLFADKRNCDELAREILAALQETQPQIPVVVRFGGCDPQLSADQFQAAGYPTLYAAPTTRAAVERIVDVHPGR